MWAASRDTRPYNSWGNGSAMRVAPVGFAFDTLDDVLDQARQSAEVTHNHPEGIKGAQAVAAVVFLARTGTDKEDIKNLITEQFEYDLSEPVDSIRTWYRFDICVRERCRKPYELSSSQPTMKMRLERRSPWAETATPLRA